MLANAWPDQLKLKQIEEDFEEEDEYYDEDNEDEYEVRFFEIFYGHNEDFYQVYEKEYEVDYRWGKVINMFDQEHIFFG